MSSIHHAGPLRLHDRRRYPQLQIEYDASDESLVFYMQPTPRPCYNPQLLDDILNLLKDIAGNQGQYETGGSLRPVRFLVMASGIPDVFNLGGDLNLFIELIRQGDRKTLTKYAHLCTFLVHQLHTHLGLPLTTVSLVQGDALGGGFEGAMCCQYIVAEEHAKLGLPEILFNLFPGMGAYSFLRRRIGNKMAREMITSGSMYSASDLHRMGVVDVIAPQGKGLDTLKHFINQRRKKSIALPAIDRLQGLSDPVTYSELSEITDIWVDTALRLTEKDMRVMQRLVRAQNAKPGAESGSGSSDAESA